MSVAASVGAQMATALARLGARERTCAVVLAAFAAVHLAWLLFRLPVPLEIFTNEAWNAWHAVAATGARSLYPGRDELIVNNYTPLSFYVVGYAGKLTGDVILAGRILSLTATLVIAGLIFRIVRLFRGGRGAAAIGALWWLASMFRSAAEYVGANDPTLPALAVMMAGFTLFLTRLQSGRSVLPGIAIMVMAGFFKHNLIVLPALALLWQARPDLKGAVVAGAFGAVLALAGLLLCQAAYGPDFLTQLTVPRAINWLRPIQHLNRLQFLAVGLIVAIVWIVADQGAPAARFTALWIGLGLASNTLQKLSPGVAINAQFELWIGSAVGLGLAMANLGRLPAVARHGAATVRGAILAIAIVRLLADPNIEPYRLASGTYRAEIAARATLVASEIEAVRAGPTPVGCNVMSICFRAGQPFVYDNFGALMRLSTGHLSREVYVARIAAMRLSYRYSDPRVSWEHGFPRPAAIAVTVPFKP